MSPPVTYWDVVDQVIGPTGICRTTFQHQLPNGFLILVRVSNPSLGEIGTTTVTFVPFTISGAPYR